MEGWGCEHRKLPYELWLKMPAAWGQQRLRESFEFKNQKRGNGIEGMGNVTRGHVQEADGESDHDAAEGAVCNSGRVSGAKE